MTQEQNTKSESKSQQISFGNKCGHNKNLFKKPKFYDDPRTRNRRPHVIEECLRTIDKMEAFYYTEFRPSRTDPLLFSQISWGAAGRLFYHDSKNRRKRRSESIESIICLITRALIYSTDLIEMAYGYRSRDNQFHPYNYSDLVAQTNQNIWRIKRNIIILKQEGYINIKKLVKQLPNGKYITTEVRIEVTDKLFKVLGLEQEFQKNRDKGIQMFNKRQAVIDAEDKRLKLFQTYQKGQFKPPKTTTTTAKITNKVSMLKSSKSPEDYTTTPRRYPPQLAHIREFLAKIVPTKGPPDKLH